MTVRRTTRAKLEKHKLYRRETLDDLLLRILKELEETVTRGDIEREISVTRQEFRKLSEEEQLKLLREAQKKAWEKKHAEK